MANMDVEEILADEVEVEEEGEDVEVTTEGKEEGTAKAKKKTRVKKPKKHAEEWMKILSGSSNAISSNDHVFIDPYFLCKDAMCPKIDGFNLFMYFYQN